ncbi:MULTISPECIES: hypothetical protein [unclassified Crossiella]|uniref:hypothetical protein n=1 Tax=unclassified Crossiella TaxID=2620835 RepID=UPI001FFFF34F|nr:MULTISPECIES: hypothetical protein [unclassified Crossiella]MCK2240085.1 hypothetical protein [Crossiella sp. S99.2]MCK2252794.1 hypothetical protein [Crossiella sp. S99.1]
MLIATAVDVAMLGMQLRDTSDQLAVLQRRAAAWEVTLDWGTCFIRLPGGYPP